MHVGLVAALMVMVALLAGSCGDDDDTVALARAEWVAAANASCVDMYEELSTIPEPESTEEIAESGGQSIRIKRAMVDRIRRLTPSPGEEAAVTELLAAFDAVVDTNEALIDAMVAAGEEGSEESETFAELDRAYATARQLAFDYGLDECFREA